MPRPAPLEWVYLVGGLALVLRYQWLFDDAFIYFRYVDNLLFLDAGLVYNLGEYVEGYSSPAHCLLLVALRWLELSWPLIVTLVGVASFVGFWALLVAANRQLSPPGPVLNLPLALLAFNYGVTSWFTSGLETPLVQLAAAGVALFALRPSSRPLAVAVGCSPLVRPELGLVVLLALAWSWWRTRRPPAWLLGAALVANGAWLLFRVWYYADLLPNTFYLKDQVAPAAGLAYAWDLVRTYHLVVLAVAVLGLAWAARRGGARPDLALAPRLFMLVAACAVAAYVVRIGGSALHYWYLAFPFVLGVAASAGLAEHALARLARPPAAVLRWAAMLALAALCASWYPRQLSGHPLGGSERATMRDGVLDAAWHRHHPALQPRVWEERVSIEAQRSFRPQLHERGYNSVRVGNWCKANYVAFRDFWVHQFGLTDALLARLDLPSRRPGHKPWLLLPAKNIRDIVAASRPPGPGMYRRAVVEGRAAPWVADNLEILELLERKIYNRHRLFENLVLALRFPGPIVLPHVPQELRDAFRRERRRRAAGAPR